MTKCYLLFDCGRRASGGFFDGLGGEEILSEAYLRVPCRLLALIWISRVMVDIIFSMHVSLRCSHSGGEARLETPSAKKLTDIGIRRIFSSEHDIFRESVRKFFQEEVVPYHAE